MSRLAQKLYTVWMWSIPTSAVLGSIVCVAKTQPYRDSTSWRQPLVDCCAGAITGMAIAVLAPGLIPGLAIAYMLKDNTEEGKKKKGKERKKRRRKD